MSEDFDLLKKQLDELTAAQGPPLHERAHRANRVLSPMVTLGGIFLGVLISVSTATGLYYKLDARIDSNTKSINSIKTGPLKQLGDQLDDVLGEMKKDRDYNRDVESRRRDRHEKEIRLLTKAIGQVESLQRAFDKAGSTRP